MQTYHHPACEAACRALNAPPQQGEDGRVGSVMKGTGILESWMTVSAFTEDPKGTRRGREVGGRGATAPRGVQCHFLDMTNLLSCSSRDMTGPPLTHLDSVIVITNTARGIPAKPQSP